MAKGVNIKAADREEVIKLHNEGHGNGFIADITGLSVQSIKRITTAYDLATSGKKEELTDFLSKNGTPAISEWSKGLIGEQMKIDDGNERQLLNLLAEIATTLKEIKEMLK